ncbi:dihydropteroate synthase [Persephonella hydrogeniphila]|uniref:Dihydropteroate synthase n=1 Tax=Persephonella hydrogeniphila TaxID=198703 RepID=A0A285MZQ6_9AQUI|nr:dihydropteroate synthase [Persephonella hydrogeniphila]SNZ02153.1 dihydropteroate synthase [Persephonella hydrogeniphila]
MNSSVHVIPEEKSIYRVIFPEPFMEPVVFETEEQLKEIVSRLKSEGKNEYAKQLTEKWININKENFKINYKGKFLNLGHKTAVMGILNLTPDSFSDGGLYYRDIGRAVERVSQMLEEGADIIDIGGESTRPGAKPVSVEEEMERVIPVIKALRKELGSNFLISIDTYKAKVAEEAIKEGADIINDISGMTFDPDMAQTVAKLDCPVVINHTRGRPDSMQENVYYDDVVFEIIEFFESQIRYGMSKGIRKDRFIIDPGIGFGKYVEHNVEIIKRLSEFKVLGLPIMIGISRKSFIELILKNIAGRESVPPTERVSGSLGATAYAVINGAHIVRTHDVKETVDFLTILDTIRGYKVV